jgi:uncharacterized protein YecE (DUF72 family)
MGTSGWSYDEWVGKFYPNKSTPKLTHYSGIFQTVEVDSSFYTIPNPNVAFGWVKHTPEDFRFSLKLPKTITHEMKLRDERVEEELRTFFKVLSPLVSSNKIGVILVQLPPSMRQDLQTLRRFLELLPRDDMKFAVEFRHRSWWNEETWEVLKSFGVANTMVDEPLLPSQVVVTAPFAYIRWHGRGERVWYDYRYSKSEILTWAHKIRSVRARELFGYWNNHFHANAVLNCLEMMDALGTINSAQRQVLEFMSNNEKPSRTLLDFQGPS